MDVCMFYVYVIMYVAHQSKKGRKKTEMQMKTTDTENATLNLFKL